MLPVVRSRRSLLFLLFLTVFYCYFLRSTTVGCLFYGPAVTNALETGRDFFHGTTDTTIPGSRALPERGLHPDNSACAAYSSGCNTDISRSWNGASAPTESDSHLTFLRFSDPISDPISEYWLLFGAVVLRCSYCFLLFLTVWGLRL